MRYRLRTVFIIGILMMPALSRAQIVYGDDIQPIFDSHCVACHGGQSGVTLGSYSAVMSSVGEQYNQNVVVPGEPDDSPIVEKIEPNPSIGERMPQGGPYLDDEQINLIRQWIEEGAGEGPPTNVADGSDRPDRFELLGNYPNPFNPGTHIRFRLPRTASWSVTVYNSAGSYITEKSGFSQGGEVSVSVNLEAQSSGMYLYVVEMRANQTTHARLSGRMTLIK